MRLSERISKAVDAAAARGVVLTQSGLARACGISRASVHAWFHGDTDSIDGKHLTTAAAYLGVNPHWLGTGAGDMLNQVGQASSMGPVTKFGTPAAIQGDPPFQIPQYSAGGAMGNGGLVLEERQPGLIKSWHVDHEWLRLNVRHHTGIANLCIVTGFGPSMQPKYNPGDPLLLDRGVTTVESDGVYFFRVGKHGFIKQLQRIPTERGLVIRAKSANKDYDPFDISDGMDFEVFGKVLTVWKSEQV